MEYSERIAQLEAQLAAANHEVRNCHALLSILAHRTPGGVVVNDHEMHHLPQRLQLSIHRDDRIPGCVIIGRPIPESLPGDQPPQPAN